MSISIFPFVGLVFFGLVAIVLKIRTPPIPSRELAFENRKELFSPAERSFYGVLQQALEESFVIFGKVRLGDVIEPARGLGRNLNQRALNKINRKHLDFVICRTEDLSLVAAVELDDSSHQRKDRADRDVFVDNALKSAGIPMVRFAAKRTYELAEVKTKLATSLSFSAPPAQTIPQPPSVAQPAAPESNQNIQETASVVTETPMVCPTCQASMVKRQAMKGPHTGKWFWACSAFPKCRKVIVIRS